MRPGRPSTPPALAAALMALGLAPLGGCLMSREAGVRLENDMAALRGQIAALSHSVDDVRARELEDHASDANKIADLTRTLSSSDRAVRTHDADLSAQLEQMTAEVQQLRGALEASEHRTAENQSTLQRDLESRLAQLQQAAQASEARRIAQEAQARTSPRNRRAALEEGIELLNKAETQSEGDKLLRELVRKYGRERGVGDEALFALGAGEQRAKQWDAALADFVKVVDFKPPSKRASEAYLGIAQCSEALGRLDDAKTFYSELTSHFAQTPAAKVARTRLDALAKSSKVRGASKAGARSRTQSATPVAPAAPSSAPAPAAPAPTTAPASPPPPGP